MKSSTYSKNGKGKIEINTLKGKENPMKSDSYGLWAEYGFKIWKSGIYGNAPKLQVKNDKRDNRNELKNEFTIAYQIVSKEIYKYRFNMDLLQDVMVSILNKIDNLELEESPLNYLKRACILRWKDDVREEIRHNLLSDKSTKEVDINSGISKEFISEMLDDIKTVLKPLDWTIFELYHIKGHTLQAIAKSLNISAFKTIANKLKRISDRIEKLNFADLVESRYILHTNKSKHNHISTFERKELANEMDIEYKKQFEGIGYKIDKSEYIPQKKNGYIRPKFNWNEKQGNYKEFKIDDCAYTIGNETNYIYHKLTGYARNVMSDSDTLNIPKAIKWQNLSKVYGKKINVSNYRIKKFKKLYPNNKINKQVKEYSRYLKYGRYLQYLTV